MTQPSRGYILLETMVAGGIVAIGLATTVTMIASSRVEATMAARRAEASSMALGIADQLMTQSGDATQALTAVPNHTGFRAGFTVANSTLRTQSTPALASDDAVKSITVTVEYPTSSGPKTFVYQRLRRKVL